MKQLTNTFTVIFILAGFASLFQLGSLGNGITTSFANSLAANVTPVLPTVEPTKVSQQKNTFIPERIVIPSVDLNLLVFSQPLHDGTWEVLPHVANYAEGTSEVNDKEGNVGLFAHDQLLGFTQIKQLTAGSEVILYGNNQKAIYKVVTSDVIESTEVDVFNPTEKPTLTLITCDGAFSEKRYMVKTELVKIENENK